MSLLEAMRAFYKVRCVKCWDCQDLEDGFMQGDYQKMADVSRDMALHFDDPAYIADIREALKGMVII